MSWITQKSLTSKIITELHQQSTISLTKVSVYSAAVAPDCIYYMRLVTPTHMGGVIGTAVHYELYNNLFFSAFLLEF